MYARVTLLEIDPLRTDVETALELYKREVVPRLREQNGYEGAYVLVTPEGKGLVMSLWEDEEAADASGNTGFYAEAIERFMTLFLAPPGRERYEVVFADAPALAID